LICQNCGKVIEVEGDLLEELEQGIEKSITLNKNHSLKFYGICDNCSLQ